MSHLYPSSYDDDYHYVAPDDVLKERLIDQIQREPKFMHKLCGFACIHTRTRPYGPQFRRMTQLKKQMLKDKLFENIGDLENEHWVYRGEKRFVGSLVPSGQVAEALTLMEDL